MNEADGNGILAAPSETHLLFCVKHACFLEKPRRLVLTLVLTLNIEKPQKIHHFRNWKLLVNQKSDRVKTKRFFKLI